MKTVARTWHGRQVEGDCRCVGSMVDHDHSGTPSSQRLVPRLPRRKHARLVAVPVGCAVLQCYVGGGHTACG
jgi:hypothetical protein